MSRWRSVLGLVAGLMLILSSAAHSLLGWSELRRELLAANVPSDLLSGLHVGWQFGGAAMLAFGIVVLSTFASHLRGRAAATLPATVVGAVYVAFGAWALAVSDLNPFFLVFVVPGTLLLVATLAGRRGAP